MENIALRSFYTFVLRVEIVIIFEPKVVTISALNTIMKKLANVVRIIIPISGLYSIFHRLQHF